MKNSIRIHRKRNKTVSKHDHSSLTMLFIIILSAVSVVSLVVRLLPTENSPFLQDQNSVVYAAGSEGETDNSGQDTSNNGESGSGRYFINNTHIIISCLVALAIAIVIAVIQANKKFK